MLQYCMPCVHEPTQHSDWPLLTSVIDRQQIFVFLKISINRNCSSVECLSYVPLHRLSMNSNGRGRQKSYIANIVPVRLSERVWCTKIFYLLLKSYFHLFGFQNSFILIYFRDGPKRCSHWMIDRKPFRCVTLHFRYRSNVVSLRHRIRSATIVLVCEQKPCPVRFSWRRESFPV